MVETYTIRAALPVLLLAGAAQAEDATYCKPYADHSMLELVTSLHSQPVQTYIRDRLYTTCLNSESPPPPPRSILDTLDVIRAPAICPATAPVVQVRTIVRTPEQTLCSSHGMHTVYAGTSWRCQK